MFKIYKNLIFLMFKMPSQSSIISEFFIFFRQHSIPLFKAANQAHAHDPCKTRIFTFPSIETYKRNGQ